jgi:gamma-glutamylcyclotransferase (GGCT)/AIG2-like uncharacterized protein YtfP
MTTTGPDAAFLYFAFGSNLDAARLHIHCPSARFVSIARLADHRLAFTIESRNTWHGGVADIVPAPGVEVWGALWVVGGEHSRPLDEQEGVFRDPPAYHRYRVTVETPAGDTVGCRAYQVVAPDLNGIAPSPAYKATILRGARAIALPPAYIETLEAIADNGYVGGGPG